MNPAEKNIALQIFVYQYDGEKWSTKETIFETDRIIPAWPINLLQPNKTATNLRIKYKRAIYIHSSHFLEFINSRIREFLFLLPNLTLPLQPDESGCIFSILFSLFIGLRAPL
jgi:hypothetical protein